MLWLLQRLWGQDVNAADDLELVRRLGLLTETIHAVIYFAPEARSVYEKLGLRGYWRGYFASRCAAVGPIGPDVATALLGGSLLR